MQLSARATSISTSGGERTGPRLALGALVASLRAMATERLGQGGLLGYFATWVAYPLFQIAVVALIYGTENRDLLNYAVVALAANTSIFTTIYFVGEILDRERVKGTLIGLFLAPCPRLSWLTGFALVGVVEMGLSAAVSLGVGYLALGVRFDPNWPALALTLALFMTALWGMGIAFSAIGLYLQKANPFSNLVTPFVILLGGVYFPVALLPDPLRWLARALPIGYGMQALADATLHHAGIVALAPQLLPLAGFAVGLPLLGSLAFRWIERAVRVRGDLDLY
jgi:ABC-2 type transport system permease protein